MSTPNDVDPWSYEEALEWLYARQGLGIKLGLEKVHELLALLGDPQHAFKVVHIAGTNGKGSVTRILANVLHRAGQRVGAFTSPHLVRFTERVEVDGAEISREAVARILARIRPLVADFDARDEPPTFFEINTLLAFVHFQEAGVDWAVVETGLGGRLDATNVVTPELSIITNVANDHAEFLGDHPADIAYEKGGIMKPGVPCVTGAEADALHVLKLISRELRCPMSILGEDYEVLPDINGFRLRWPLGEARYDLAMAGAHQIQNAALVVAAAGALRGLGHTIPEPSVQQALATVQVPGRMEQFTLHEPVAPAHAVEVLLDGAHNEAGAGALRYHLGRIDWAGFHLIVGFNRDKNWQVMLDQWMPLAAHVWAVPLRTSRSLAPVEICAYVAPAGFPTDEAQDVADAIARAIASGARRIVLAGSLFLVGEARAHITGEPMEEIRGNQ